MEWDKILTAVAGVIIASGSTYAAIIGARVRKDQKASQVSIESGQSEGTEKIISGLGALTEEVRLNRLEASASDAANQSQIAEIKTQQHSTKVTVEILQAALHGLIQDASGMRRAAKKTAPKRK